MIEKTILEEMVAQVNKKTGENVITIDDVRNVLYGMSLDNVDYNNIPLSKLTYDLLKKG